MFVNVACDLVLSSKVQKACHQGSSIFFFFWHVEELLLLK